MKCCFVYFLTRGRLIVQVWNNKPLDLENWEVRVEFGIYGRARIGADGLAIWYTKEHGQVCGVQGKQCVRCVMLTSSLAR